MNVLKIQAITSLYPGAEVYIRGDEVVWVNPSTAPITDAEIEAELVRLQAEYDSKQYQRDRASEYPPLAEQLDMLYHDRINNTDTWMEAIQAVKTKYPKS